MSSTEDSYSYSDSGTGTGSASYSYSDSGTGTGTGTDTGSASYSYSDSGSASGSGSGSGTGTGSGSYSYSDTGSASGSDTGSGSGSGSGAGTGSGSYSYSDTGSGSDSYSYSKTSKSGSQSGSDYSYSSSSGTGTGSSKSSSDYSYSYSDSGKSDGSYSYSYSDDSKGVKGKTDRPSDSYSYSYSYSDDDKKGKGKGSDGSYSYSYSGYSDYYSGDYYTDYYSDDYYDDYYSDYDYSGSYYEYSTDSQYISEFTRERLNYLPLKDWFSDLPEPVVQKTKRNTRDPYFLAIQENILRLRVHVRNIQIEEQQLLKRYVQQMEHEDDVNAEKPREKDAERARLNFLEQLAYVRKSRKQYRALLYDAITQRNNMIEAAEIRADEAKNRDLQLWSLGRHKEVDYFLGFLFGLQMLVMLLMIIFFEFDLTSRGELARNQLTSVSSEGAPLAAPYTLYMDSVIMLFAGFGFLMTFVKKYAFSGLSYAFLISAFSLQWALFWLGMFEEISNPAPLQKTFLSIPHLQAAVYGATAVAISCGAVLGRLDPLQLAIMAVFETFFYALNIFLALELSSLARGTTVWSDNAYAQTFGRMDPGGGMFVHMFGCYFGLVISFAFRPKANEPRDDRDERTDYTSNMFAFFGTAVMLVLFPSFNAAFAYADGGGPQRVAINTILALLGSIVGASTLSHCAVQSGNKFGPLEMHHAVLAGGVAVASTSTYFLPPFAALIIGWLVGIISTACYLYLTPALKRFLRLGDTAGVHSLHGIPGLLGAAISLIVVALSDEIVEGLSTDNVEVPINDQIAMQVPSFNSTVSVGFSFDITPQELYAGKTGASYATTHLTVLAFSFFLPMVGALFTVFVLWLLKKVLNIEVERQDRYQDKTAFIVPEDYPGE